MGSEMCIRDRVFTLDSMEAIRATLRTFGFTIDGHTQNIVLTGDFDYGVSLRNILGVLDEGGSHSEAADFTVSAPAGTTMTDIANGITRIEQGGPLSMVYSIFDGSSSSSGTVDVQSGECFGENFTPELPFDLSLIHI